MAALRRAAIDRAVAAGRWRVVTLAADPASVAPTFRIGGVPISAVRFEDTLQRMLELPSGGRPIDVHFCTAHTVVEAARDERLLRVLESASLACPDGMPLVWMGRLRGKPIERVCGPDLMLALMDRGRRRAARHYLYGGVDGVAERLAAQLEARFPGLLIVGIETPPFRPLTAPEEDALADRINTARADYVWCGLGTPKQDFWVLRFRSRLRAAALFAVGAAFDFHSGARRRAPRWMQRSGTEWLFRLAMEPRRLARRYTTTNLSFLSLLFRDVVGIAERRTFAPQVDEQHDDPR